MASHDVNGIKAKINDQLKAAEAILKLAESEDRELSDQDRLELDAHVAAIGCETEGEQTGLHKDLARAKALESVSSEMARKSHELKPTESEAVVAGDAGWDNPRVAKARIRSLGFHRSTETLAGFKGPDAERNAYMSGMWLRATLLKDDRAIDYCRDHGILGQNKESVDADGGYLTPTPLSTAIWEVQNEVGLALRVTDVVPMASDAMNIPKLTAGPTVYYPGEAAAITASKATFGTIALAAVKKSVLVKISNELIADSIIDVASRIASRAGYELANQTDAEFLAGDGSSSYGSQTGVVDAIGAAGKVTMGSGDTAWANTALADLNDLVAKLPSAYTPNASFIVHRQFYSSVIQRLLYAAGGNTTDTISGPTFSGGASAFLFGYPVYFSDHMPADAANKCAALFGDWSKAVALGLRQDISIGMSTEYAFDEDVTTMRAQMRSNLVAHDPGDGSDAGGYVGLFTAAS